MPDIAESIPPEAWPLIDQLFRATLIAAVIWLLLTGFVMWRRSASNLTPVNAARTNKSAKPDFLKIDQKARDAAIKRGEQFDEELERQEKIEARGGVTAISSIGQRAAGIVTFLMSLFSLAAMIYGSIVQVSRMGKMISDYSTLDEILKVIKTHPIAFSVALFVIIYQTHRFISQRKWKGE